MQQPKIARFLRAVPRGDGWWVTQYLFKVTPPMSYQESVVYRKGKLLHDKRGRLPNRLKRQWEGLNPGEFPRIDRRYTYSYKTRTTAFVVASASDLKSMMARSHRKMREDAMSKKSYYHSLRPQTPDIQVQIDECQRIIELFKEEEDNRFEVETFLFACDKFGKWKNSGELPGSQRGTLDHTIPFKDLGYTVIGMPRLLIMDAEVEIAPPAIDAKLELIPPPASDPSPRKPLQFQPPFF